VHCSCRPPSMYATTVAKTSRSTNVRGRFAWTRVLLLDGERQHAEPKTLRYRLLHIGPRVVRTARRTCHASHCNGPGHTTSPPHSSASPHCHGPARESHDQPSTRDTENPADFLPMAAINRTSLDPHEDQEPPPERLPDPRGKRGIRRLWRLSRHRPLCRSCEPSPRLCRQ
jgi:hypothetical protein